MTRKCSKVETRMVEDGERAEVCIALERRGSRSREIPSPFKRGWALDQRRRGGESARLKLVVRSDLPIDLLCHCPFLSARREV